MLGSTRDMTPWFVPSPTLGMPNMGGPMVTDGGLAFVGAFFLPSAARHSLTKEFQSVRLR